MTDTPCIKESYSSVINTHTHGSISRRSAVFLKRAYEKKILNRFTLMNVMDLSDCGYNMAVAVVQELNACEMITKARRGSGIYMAYLAPEEYEKLCKAINKEEI